MLHGTLFVLVAVDSRLLLDLARCNVPYMEVTSPCAQEDARVRGGWVECSGGERRTLDVERCKKRIRVRWIRVDVVQVQRRARAG